MEHTSIAFCGATSATTITGSTPTIASAGIVMNNTTTFSSYHYEIDVFITEEMFKGRNIGDFITRKYSRVFIEKKIKDQIIKEKNLFKQMQDSCGGKIFWFEDANDTKWTAHSRIENLKGLK